VALSATVGSAVRAADTVKVGFSMPLTGPLASNGKAILTAYQMWQEDTNANGGLLGRNVELVHYDDQSNPTLVPAIYAKLLDIDKVDLIISSYGTNMTMPAMPVVMPKNLVLMSLFALAVNEQFRYRNYFSMFPAGPDAIHDISRGFFEIAKEQPLLQTVAIVGADTDFAKKAADGARDNAIASSFKIVHERSYPPTTIDFAPIMRSVQAANPDFVYVASYPADSVGIVRAANEVRLKAKLFGGNMVGLQYGALKTQLGTQLNNIVVHDFYVPEPTLRLPGIEEFLKRYQAKAAATNEMDQLGFFVPPFAYANLQVLGQAVEATGSLDHGRLGEHLRSQTFSTIVGNIKFAPNGEWAKPRVLMVQFQGVRGHDLEQFKKPGTQVIVFPKELATGAVRFPYLQ